ncbi:glycosyltransferase [Flavitalea sp.]|nr:glycosyltransferase [Flavitalea sp.]
MSTNKISVIIVLYYSKHLLPAIISNVIEKVKECGEILLINNSSDDLEIFESDSVKVIYPTYNMGYGAAINLGVSKSKYDSLLILNPDLKIEKFDIYPSDLSCDLILSGKNPKIEYHYLKFPNLLSCFFSIAVIDLVYIKMLDKWVHYRKQKNDIDDYVVDYVSGALMLLNKKAFYKIGGFDSSYFLYYEETDFCKRANKLGIPVLCTSKIVFTPAAAKASSKNVDNIKIRAGILSCRRYHLKYSGRIATKFTFLLLKLLYGLVILFLYPLSVFNNKLKNKRNICLYRFTYL